MTLHTSVPLFFFFQAEDGIRDYKVTGVQTCALPIYERQKVHQVARDEERAPHVLPAGRAHPGDQLWIVEEVADPERGAVHGVDHVAGHVGNDLLREAARVATDHGLALPHRLGGAEFEPRAHRLLPDYRGRPPGRG